MTDTNGDPTAGNGGGSGDGDNGRGNNKGGNGNQTVSLKGMTKAERKAYKKRVKEEAAAKREVKVLLNNSLAFGGYDAVLCLAKPGVLPEGTGLPKGGAQ